MTDKNDGLGCLIEALTILRKYGTRPRPTHCEHDVMIITCIDSNLVSEEDKIRLEELGFRPGVGNAGDCFGSFRFGSS